MALSPPLFESPKADPSSDATLLQPSAWNRVISLLKRLFDGGDAHGSVLVRDTTDVTDGGAWVPTAAGVLAASGPGVLPTFRPLTTGDLPPAAPLAHHVSHETGGADAVTTLDASVIKTGTVATARLPATMAPSAHATTHQAGGSDALAALDAGIVTTGTLANARLAPDVVVANSVAVGTTTATSGAIRLPAGALVNWRNVANTADVGLNIDS